MITTVSQRVWRSLTLKRMSYQIGIISWDSTVSQSEKAFYFFIFLKRNSYFLLFPSQIKNTYSQWQQIHLPQFISTSKGTWCLSRYGAIAGLHLGGEGEHLPPPPHPLEPQRVLPSHLHNCPLKKNYYYFFGFCSSLAKGSPVNRSDTAMDD